MCTSAKINEQSADFTASSAESVVFKKTFASCLLSGRDQKSVSVRPSVFFSDDWMEGETDGGLSNFGRRRHDHSASGPPKTRWSRLAQEKLDEFPPLHEVQ